MISFYGLSLSSAIFISFWLTALRAERMGLSAQIVWDSLPWVLVFGVVGARLYHILNYLPFYIDHLLLVPQIWLGGLGIWGGLAGGLIGIIIFSNFNRNQSSTTLLHSNVVNKKIQILRYLDAGAPLIPLAQAIGRVGNVFNGENLPYAYWEIVTNFLIFIFLIFIERLMNSRNLASIVRANEESREPFDRAQGKPLLDASRLTGLTRRISKPGYLFFLYLICYSLGRFFLEFFRADSPWIFGVLTVAQWVSLGIFLTILSFLLFKKFRSEKPTT